MKHSVQPDLDLCALGEALAVLRRDRRLSQAEAGGRIDMTSQGWGLYEAGRRPGLFRPDVQRRLTAALDSTPEDLAFVAARQRTTALRSSPPPTGVESGFVAYDPEPGRFQARPATLERLQVSNDDLAPWASSGVVLEFDWGRWPRRDQGCVIDAIDGERLIRLYDRADADRLYLRGGPGGLDAATVLERARIARIAAVVSRQDV